MSLNPGNDTRWASGYYGTLVGIRLICLHSDDLEWPWKAGHKEPSNCCSGRFPYAYSYHLTNSCLFLLRVQLTSLSCFWIISFSTFLLNVSLSVITCFDHFFFCSSPDSVRNIWLSLKNNIDVQAWLHCIVFSLPVCFCVSFKGHFGSEFSVQKSLNRNFSHFQIPVKGGTASRHFNGHFPGGPVLAVTRTSLSRPKSDESFCLITRKSVYKVY